MKKQNIEAESDWAAEIYELYSYFTQLKEKQKEIEISIGNLERDKIFVQQEIKIIENKLKKAKMV